MNKILLGRWVFAFLICCALLLLASNRMWSGNVDIAHHYALVTRLFDLGNVGAVDPSLGEMLTYPRLAHRFAAWFGMPFDSPIVGLQIAGLCSMIAAWVGIVSMLASFGRNVRVRALVAVALMLVANRLLFKLDVFGDELVGNYFFAQLFAQAAMLCALAIALSLERRNVPSWIRYAFLIVAILVIESAHLLPALETLICIGILMLSDLANQWGRKHKVSRLRFSVYFLLSGIVLLATAAAVIVHPTFSAMRAISENNGGLTVSRFGSVTSLAMLALVVIVSSVLLLVRWQIAPAAIRHNILPFKYFGALGLSTSILFLLQCIALHYGQGSEYACKKYAVALCTSLLIQVVLHFVARRAVFLDATETANHPSHAFGEVLLPGMVIAVAFIAIMPKAPTLTIRELRKLEVQTRQIAPLLAQRNSTLPSIAVHLPTMNAMLDYMFTIAVFKAPRSHTVMHLIANQGPKNLGEFAAIVTARDDSVYDDKACRLPFATTDLVAIDTVCYSEMQRKASVCRSDFDFTKAGSVGPLMLNGFSMPEEEGTWTDGPDASFNCEVPPGGAFKPTQVEIVASAFVVGNRRQQATVSSNALHSSQTAMFTHPGEVRTISLSLAPDNSGRLTLRFAMPDAISPKEMGVNADVRRLGLQIKAIHFR